MSPPSSFTECSPSHEHEEMDERDHINGAIDIEEENILADTDEGTVTRGESGIIGGESIIKPCPNLDLGCNEYVEYIHSNRNAHEPCECPLKNCNFIGSHQQLSLHFSSKHWDSGRQFQYDCPLDISLRKDDDFLVLQAEEDGTLFLLNKGTESVGYTLMITCLGPSSSSRAHYFYEIASERGGSSSLRLKSFTMNHPGRFEIVPQIQMDFLLIPFSYINIDGDLELEVCIWNSSCEEW